MSIFYFTTRDNREYELSCTSSISVSEPAVVTKSPVETGDSIVDNYYIDNRMVTYRGVITNIVVRGQDAERKKAVDTWIEDVRTIRRNKEMVTVHCDTLKIIPNCVITTFDISKTKEQGRSGWACTLAFQEVDISERARIVSLPVAVQSQKDKVDPQENSSSSGKVEVEEELATSLDVRIKQVVVD